MVGAQREGGNLPDVIQQLVCGAVIGQTQKPIRARRRPLGPMIPGGDFDPGSGIAGAREVEIPISPGRLLPLVVLSHQVPAWAEPSCAVNRHGYPLPCRMAAHLMLEMP